MTDSVSMAEVQAQRRSEETRAFVRQVKRVTRRKFSPEEKIRIVLEGFRPGRPLVSAKSIIAAVDDATKKVQEAPETYPLHASLLSDVTALMVQQARSALERTTELLEEALKSNPDRTEEEVAALKDKLQKPLIGDPQTHSAILGAKEAAKIGLPVIEADAACDQWRAIWRLWTRYFALGFRVYEGARVSQVMPWAPAT